MTTGESSSTLQLSQTIWKIESTHFYDDSNIAI